MPHETTRDRPTIRHLCRDDFAAVVLVERRVNPGDYWDKDDLLDRLRCRNVVGMVIATRQAIVGYYIYSVHKHHLSILRIAIDPFVDAGELLERITRKMRMKLRPASQTTVDMDVSEDNVAVARKLASLSWQSRLIRARRTGEPDAIRFYLVAQELDHIPLEELIAVDRTSTA